MADTHVRLKIVFFLKIYDTRKGSENGQKLTILPTTDMIEGIKLIASSLKTLKLHQIFFLSLKNKEKCHKKLSWTCHHQYFLITK